MAVRSQELLNCGRSEDEKTLHDLLEAVHCPDGSRKEDFEVKDVIPVPSFVVKTKDENERKVFINVCGCPEIPAPGDWKDGKVPKDVVSALKSQTTSDVENEALRFPLSLGVSREDVDKQGETCVVYDCLFNLDVILAAKSHRKLKVFLIGLAIEWTSHKNDMRLSTDYKLPKMHYKGKEIQPHRVKVRKDPMVQEIKATEDVSFPLPVNESARRSKSELVNDALPKLEYKIEYKNRPVDKVVVYVDLPSGEVKPEIWISGFVLNIDVKGIAQRCTIELPFTVDPNASLIDLHSQEKQLTVTLPFKSISTVLDELREKKAEERRAVPLQTGQLIDFEMV